MMSYHFLVDLDFMQRHANERHTCSAIHTHTHTTELQRALSEGNVLTHNVLTHTLTPPLAPVSV